MKLVNRELRGYVYGKLNGNATVTGITGAVPVKSIAGKDQAFPYIEIGTIESFDESPKDVNITRSNVSVNIYTRFADENASYTLSENISSKVIELLNDQIGDTTSFSIWMARFVSSIENFEQTDTDKVIWNQLIFEYQLQEL